MRILKEMTEADFRYSLKSIDNDFNAGRITREQASESTKKLKKAYQTGQANRDIARAADRASGYVVK